MRPTLLKPEFRRFPKSWVVVPFTDVVYDVTSGNAKVKQSEYVNQGPLPIIDQGIETIGGYTNDVDLACDVEVPCIVFGDHTRIFKYITFPFALGADGVKVLKTRNDLDPRFAFYYLRQVDLPKDAGYSRHFKYLKEAYVPLPPLSEQKRIAAILDKADALRRKRQQALALLDDFLQAVFLDMFGDPVTNPKGWEVKQVGEIAKVTTGNTPSRKHTDYYGHGVEWIKSDNINTPSHFLTGATEHLTVRGKAVGRVVPKGAVLITCIAGSPSCIGNVAIADREVAFNQQINALTPIMGVNTYYLYYLIKLSRKLIQGASTNSMKGMVSKSALSQVLLPTAPTALQHAFGETFLGAIRTDENLVTTALATESLFNSLVQRAFRGEL